MGRVLPILFSTEMVQAILEGRKTVTRRIIKPQPRKEQDHKLGVCIAGDKHDVGKFVFGTNAQGGSLLYVRPPYRPGDIMYVRETWAFATCINCNGDYIRKGAPANCYDYQAVEYDDGDSISDGCFIYKADCENTERITWRPSIHMPRAAARIWLKVKEVRVEHLQEMTLDDFLSEGIVIPPEAFNDPENAYLQARDNFIDIWDSTIPRGQQVLYGWEADPWTWVIEFERCGKPESGGWEQDGKR